MSKSSKTSILIAFILVLTLGWVSWSYVKTKALSHNELIICEIGGHEFQIPQGYFRYGAAAVMGCNRGEHLFFSAYSKDPSINPHDVFNGMHPREYLPNVVTVSIDASREYGDWQTKLTKDRKERPEDFTKINDKVLEDNAARKKKFGLVKGYRLFYFLSSSGTVHIITCSLHKSRPGGQCGGSYTFNGMDIDYDYPVTTNEPILEIIESVETLIYKFYQAKKAP